MSRRLRPSPAARSRAMLLLAACLVAGALLAACSGGSGGGSLTVTDAWVRAAARGGTTAAYLTVTNGRGSDDTLVGVSTDAAESASLHRTMTGDSGMTGMQMTDEVPVKAGASVKLEPGGYHVMLEGLKADLAAGATVTLILTFEQAGPVTVSAGVRAN
jgi:periplasmic copper chaperone A